MDARELTKVVEKMRSEQQDMKRMVDYLEQEVAKLRMLVNDMQYDLMDLQRRN
jgi:predicted  nucleic acid-binding Zn-ribbon protein